MTEKEKLYLANEILIEVKPLKLREKILSRLIDFLDKKIPEGAVVLTREEYEILLDIKTLKAKAQEALNANHIGELIEVELRTRKETAREILDLLYSQMPKTQIVVEIEKRYGVEVK